MYMEKIYIYFVIELTHLQNESLHHPRACVKWESSITFKRNTEQTNGCWTLKGHFKYNRQPNFNAESD